jgi:hypothetical protein
VTGVASTIAGYLAWRLGGTPSDSPDAIETRLQRAESAAVVFLMRDFFEHESPMSEPLISVVLPTRDRPKQLRRAVESVRRQAYRNWELVVVNDGETADIPSEPDERIMVVDNGGEGVAAARNLGLDSATGELVTYLDDDNVMDALWLKALVLTLDERPEASVLIGAQMVTPDPGEPEHHFVRFPPKFDWVALTEANYVDMGMLAHSAAASTRFDESLDAFVDWDFVVRLTYDRSPVLVPAVSGVYLTGTEKRISYQDRTALLEQVRARFARMRELRTGDDLLAIGHHDADALASLAQRLADASRQPIAVCVLGSSTAATAARKALTRISDIDVTDQPERSRESRMVVIDEPMPALALGEGALLVGLRAHQYDYGPTMDLGFSRAVGDQMWVGSSHRIDFEQLFDGATLVKFGLA